ncbi:hypothetical protein NG796_21230 [Laspinema sp. A4]|uniref:hypothetical protein n=1 Tax=Laspinema sp. D2d TaxID=2953686 RepID=UPI0021BA78E1|nr:hypothetical protein [Laspinema sp. D2d]MCT7985802.1 hypothetical protein [Laspinema sp. D2d]
MKGELVPFRYAASDLNIEFEEISQYSYNLHLQPMKVIYNAWSKAAKIDRLGMLWIDELELHNILRTTKDNANYIALEISDKYKVIHGGKTYIQGSEVCRLLNDVIQTGNTLLRRRYASFSEKIYKIIRDSDQAELLRCEYWETVNTVKKKLKKTRIKMLKIENDELTNLPLEDKSEFSHIRKASIHIVIADKYWNGLIVNHDTHKIITQRGINDEDQLLDLCQEYNWDTTWFSVFCESLQSLDF